MPSPLFPLALRALQQGRAAEAANHCRTILRGSPDDAEALRMLSVILLQQTRPAEALPFAERAAALSPHDAAAQGALGTILLQLGRAAEALAPLERALRADPRNAALHNSRAGALQALARLDEAVAAYDKALAAGPAHPQALLQRGHVLMALKRPAEALASYDKALAARADPARASCARGTALLALGRAAEAAVAFERTLAQIPDDKDARNNLAVAYQHLGRDDEALAIYDGLLANAAADDLSRFGRAQIHLAHGRFAQGWADHKARHSAREHRALLHQEPLAADLSGETFWLRKDQGLGDELFFLRFAPELKRRGARIVYQAGAKIGPLVRRIGLLDEVIDEDAPIPNAARVLSIGDLPHVLGHASREAVPQSLRVAPLPARTKELAERLAAIGPAPYLGVTWRAGTAEGLSKRLPIEAFAAALSGVPGTLVSLQRLPVAGETERFAAVSRRPVHDLSALNDDLEGMLALLAALDDYATVSNTNVHLRALAGLPSRLLVPMPAEWRWMASGEQSPWFPASRIYRQSPFGNWDDALNGLAADLESVFSRSSP